MVDTTDSRRQRGDGASPPARLAAVVSHPVHYFAPLYRELSSREGIELTVYFLSDVSVREHFDPGFARQIAWDTDLLSGYRHRILHAASRRPVRGGVLQRPHVGVLRELAREKFDAYWLHGYNHSSLALAAALGRLRGDRVLIRDDQTLIAPRPRYKVIAKEIALRALFSGIYGLYVGEANKDYFRRYGVPESRLVWVPHCVDNDYFQRSAANLAEKRDELRRAIGIDDDAPAVLFVGKLIEQKAPLHLLAAFRQVVCERDCWLVYAGEGPQRPDLEAEIRAHDIPNVRLVGFVNQSVLPEIYGACDVFVLPSIDETWGLVVNEAMNFCLPVVVSDHVGAARNLVRHGWNGFVYPAGAIRPLSNAIRTLVSDRELRTRFGESSRNLVQRYSVQAAADGIVAAVGMGAS